MILELKCIMEVNEFSEGYLCINYYYESEHSFLRISFTLDFIYSKSSYAIKKF